jgi:hypothetical protein
MVKFRPHRGSLAAAMEEVKEFQTFEEFYAFLEDEFRPWDSIELTRENLSFSPYAVDTRIGWETFLVYLERYGVVGFTNGDFSSEGNGTVE